MLHQVQDGRVRDVGREAPPQDLEQFGCGMRDEAREPLHPLDVVFGDRAGGAQVGPQAFGRFAFDAREIVRHAGEPEARHRPDVQPELMRVEERAATSADPTPA